MALLWADGFDCYGTDESKMTDGLYATTGNATLDTVTFNTGTAAMHIVRDNSSSFGGLRKVLPAAKLKVGAAGRFYFPTLPDNNGASMIFSFMSSDANRGQVSICVNSNGQIEVYRGCNVSFSPSSGTLIATSDPIINAESWNHIEVQVNIHDTTGWVRVAINGIHRFAASSLDTAYDATQILSVSNHVSYSAAGASGNPATCYYYMDDYYIYDFVGSSAVETDFVPTTDGSGVATNYIGELQCMYLPPNGDTAEADWTKSTGVDGYALIDELSPDDADYIQSATATDLSEFALTDLPVDITYIRGLMLLGRMSKSDSGSCGIKFGMKSVAATADSAEFAITTTPTYWYTFQNTDPNSSARWTRASLNAAWFRLTRSL